jgi:hypothetical protein
MLIRSCFDSAGSAPAPCSTSSSGSESETFRSRDRAAAKTMRVTDTFRPRARPLIVGGSGKLLILWPPASVFSRFAFGMPPQSRDSRSKDLSPFRSRISDPRVSGVVIGRFFLTISVLRPSRYFQWAGVGLPLMSLGPFAGRTTARVGDREPSMRPRAMERLAACRSRDPSTTTTSSAGFGMEDAGPRTSTSKRTPHFSSPARSSRRGIPRLVAEILPARVQDRGDPTQGQLTIAFIPRIFDRQGDEWKDGDTLFLRPACDGKRPRTSSRP